MRRRNVLLPLSALLLLAALLGLWARRNSNTVAPTLRDAPPRLSGGPRLDGSPREDSPTGEVPAQPDVVVDEAAWVVTGRVVTAEHVPLSGAHVRLVGSLRWRRAWRTAASDTTRDGGTFRLESEDAEFSGGPWVPSVARLLVEAPGHVYAWLDVSGLAVGARLELGDVPMRGTHGAIAGRVVGLDGVPLAADVHVKREDELEPEPGELFKLVRATDCASEPTTGTFTTAPLPPGLYRLRIKLDPAAYFVLEHVAAGTNDLLVRLPHVPRADLATPFDLRVRVRHEAFAGAPPVPAQAPFFTQDGGDLSAERLEQSDVWLLRGVRPIARPLLVHPGVGGWGPAVLTDLSPDGAVREVLLPRGRALHGVVQLEGRGVPARVQLSFTLGPGGALPHATHDVPFGQQRRQDTTYADAEGRFSFVGLPPGTISLWVNSVHDDHWYPTSVPADQRNAPRPPFHWWGWHDVPLDPEGEVLLAVERLVPLVLELMWPAGEPRVPKPRDVHAWQHLDTGQGSALAVEEVAWDGSRLVVRLPRPVSSKPIDVLLRTPETWALLRDVSPRPEPYRAALELCARIEGRVLGPQGEPQPDARVTGRYRGLGHPVADRYRPSARCDEQGRFVLRPSLPGPYVLEPTVSWEGVVGIPLEATTDAEPVSLRLASARWLVGRVAGPEGVPLPEAWVIVLFPGVDPGDADSEHCTDDGFFRIAAPDDRPVTLLARDEAGRTLGELHVPRDAPPTDLRLALRAAR